MIDSQTGTSYGVEIKQDGDQHWHVLYGWFPKEDPTFIPPNPRQGGLVRASQTRLRFLEDHPDDEARVVRRDVTIQVVNPASLEPPKD